MGNRIPTRNIICCRAILKGDAIVIKYRFKNFLELFVCVCCCRYFGHLSLYNIDKIIAYKTFVFNIIGPNRLFRSRLFLGKVKIAE